jgi:GNAT superfamily N-acetyltransferase
MRSEGSLLSRHPEILHRSKERNDSMDRVVAASPSRTKQSLTARKALMNLDWGERAIRSEIAFSTAYGGIPVAYERFVHIHNPAVPWGGDFNRAIGLRLTDFASFTRVVDQVENLHREKRLDRPDCYEVYPPALDEDVWREPLAERGFQLTTAIFMEAAVLKARLPAGCRLYPPSEGEYLAWYQDRLRSTNYYDEAWFQQLKGPQAAFIRTFKPFWLLKDETLLGWIYCANLGDFGRLFEVEIRAEYRGQGFGRVLLDAIRLEGARQGIGFILLRTGRRLREFYEKAGFAACTTYSIIRLMV